MRCEINEPNEQQITLSEDEEDVLQELINVAYGNATAVVADMLDAFASLSIPNIRVMPTTELVKELRKLKNISYFFSNQAFIGEFSGESVFFINEDSANNLAKHLELESKEELDDAILELTNILTSALISKLVQQIDTQVIYSVPNISKIPLIKIDQTETFQVYSQVIVIDTQLNFEDQMINAKIFILTKDDSIVWLKKRLNNILETLI